GDSTELHSFPTRRSSDLLEASLGIHHWRGRNSVSTLLLLRSQTCGVLDEDKGGERLWQRGSSGPDPGQCLAPRADVSRDRRQIRDRKSTRLNSSHVAISY